MKKITAFIFIILLIVILIPQVNAESEETMGCDGQIIEIGEYKYVVRKWCGKPCHKELIRSGLKNQKKVEHWAYEWYGTTYCLIFEDGKLASIERR